MSQEKVNTETQDGSVNPGIDKLPGISKRSITLLVIFGAILIVAFLIVVIYNL